MTKPVLAIGVRNSASSGLPKCVRIIGVGGDGVELTPKEARIAAAHIITAAVMVENASAAHQTQIVGQLETSEPAGE